MAERRGAGKAAGSAALTGPVPWKTECKWRCGRDGIENVLLGGAKLHLPWHLGPRWPLCEEGSEKRLQILTRRWESEGHLQD